MVGPEDRSVAQIVYKVRIYWALLCARYPEKKRKGNSRGADKDPKECKKRKSFSLLASRVPSVLRRALFMAGGGGCGEWPPLAITANAGRLHNQLVAIVSWWKQ